MGKLFNGVAAVVLVALAAKLVVETAKSVKA